MSDMCIIEHLADGTHSCRTHQSIGGALCQHAAAALQARVVELASANATHIARIRHLSVEVARYMAYHEVGEARVRELSDELALARDTTFWLDCRWKEPSQKSNERGANVCLLEGTKVCAVCLLADAEARVRELEAMWAAKAEVGDARIDRAEQAVGRLQDAALPFLNLKDKGNYAIGVITTQDIERLEAAFAASGEPTAPSPPSAD